LEGTGLLWKGQAGLERIDMAWKGPGRLGMDRQVWKGLTWFGKDWQVWKAFMLKILKRCHRLDGTFHAFLRIHDAMVQLNSQRKN
jgi:hypothetical protein